MTPAEQARWMGEAIAEAEAAAAHDDVPIGAVVVHDGAVVGRGHNRREVDQDPTAHAEVLALREAAAALGRWRLDDCTLVVTLEPCAMCAGATVLARLGTLVFGADDPKAGAVGALWDIPRDPRLNHVVEVVRGVQAEACGDLLRTFFRARRAPRTTPGSSVGGTRDLWSRPPGARMDHLDGWRTEVERFAYLLDGAELTARVPACPDWDVADLAFHLGWVFDRFAQIAGQRLTEKDQVREVTSIDRPDDDTELPAWFRTRVAQMDAVLADLDPSEPVWNFTRAPHDGAWVLRRMHHETAVHRHDLEEVGGGAATPIPDDVAADGVAELMGVLSTAGTRWEGERRATIQVTEDATGRTWRLRLDPGERPVPDDISVGAADAILHGTGEALLLALWRRRPLDTVTFTGDEVLANEVLAAIGR